MAAATPAQSDTPGAMIASSGVKGQPGARVVPFRTATLERVERGIQTATVMAAGSQPIESVIEGTGYLAGVMLHATMVTAANAAAVAFHEDAPSAALAQVTLRDPNGDTVNVRGFDLALAMLINKRYSGLPLTSSAQQSTIVAGAVATGGSFAQWIRVPTIINNRTLIGLLGNQDRSVKWFLRTDVASGAAAATGPIYTTAPTNFGTLTIERFIESYAVPPNDGPYGRNEQIPPGYGTLHFVQSGQAAEMPIPGTVDHFIRRIGNTVRWYALVFRSNGSRATAQVAANHPTTIALKTGDTDIINETFDYRRALMFERYGFDFPDGVLVYDFLHDNVPGSGSEFGDDWLNLSNVNNVKFSVTYPAGFGAANNSLTVVSSELAISGMVA